MANDIKLPSLDDIKTKFSKTAANLTPRHSEINLVPDIKNDMIKTLKLRNFIFFICIIVAAASAVISLIFGITAGGQQAIVDSKQNTIKNLSQKITDYKDLNKFLTIKNQLSGLSEISDNKKVLSRVFNVLSALIPTGSDTIQISEISINLAEDPVTISFDAQANAGSSPYYDYRVLDAFNKSMKYMRYDYGEYVDKNGATIPAYCIIETNTDGSNFRDDEKGIYALWLINGEGCNPSFTPETNDNGEITNITEATKGYEDSMIEYDNQTVVKIWRTPQFANWYKENPNDEDPYITLDGEIGNVAHFESSCISYAGIKNYQNTGNESETVYAATNDITWLGTNSTCNLVSTNENNEPVITITESSNGRSSGGDLVLRFSANIGLNQEVFSFSNKHMIAIGPSKRYNVTDSYVQIQNMFTQAASDCLPNDTTCNNNQNNRNGGN